MPKWVLIRMVEDECEPGRADGTVFGPFETGEAARLAALRLPSSKSIVEGYRYQLAQLTPVE